MDFEQRVAVRELIAALEDVLEQHNPFITDAETCECGEYGTGWSGDDMTGDPCCHIRAVRAIDAARKQLEAK